MLVQISLPSLANTIHLGICLYVLLTGISTLISASLHQCFQDSYSLIGSEEKSRLKARELFIFPLLEPG